MALDRVLSLIQDSPTGSPAQSVRSVINGLKGIAERWPTANGVLAPAGLHYLGTATTDQNITLYLPPMSLLQLEGVIDRMSHRQLNPYATLGSEGILVISSVVPRDGNIILSGGSYCDVRLKISNGKAVIVKSVSEEGKSNYEDGFLRHKNEAAWLMAANRVCDLFPHVGTIRDNAGSYEFETAFFPAYSAAELVFQRRLTGDQLGDALISVLDELRSTFYVRPPIPTIWRDKDQNYLEKIRRRSELFIHRAGRDMSPLGALLQASEIHVNGRRCAPLSTILDAVSSDRVWQPIAHPAQNHSCHGDLILEDILMIPGPRPEMKLIDPNPYNQNAMLDLAKMMLSLFIGYEFVYFDFFEVQTKVGPGGKVAVEVELGAQECMDDYKVAASQVMRYARKELSPVLGITRSSFDRLIGMSAALTALAIPSFHSLRHRRPDRAEAFLALGLLHASSYLEDGTTLD